MKPKIHPKYQQATVSCASCKTTFEIGSTRSELRVDVCNNCHPFFTGKQRLMDTEGRVEKFNRKYAKKEATAVETTPEAAPTATEA